MAANVLQKYVWLFNTLRQAGLNGLRFQEINEKWRQSHLNEFEECLSKKTFSNWKQAVEKILFVTIDYDVHDCTYHLQDTLLYGKDLRDWLLDSFTVINAVAEYKSLGSRILTEPILSSQQYLQPLMDAMHNSHPIVFVYRSFDSDEDHERLVEPYCLKLFHQRWYLLCFSHCHQSMRIYALDRINKLKICYNETFKMNEFFDASTYFTDFFGVFMVRNQSAQEITIQTTIKQGKYLEALPLHHTQELLSTDQDGSVFQYRLIPTYDFIQQLLSLGSTVKVLKPVSLVEQMRSIIDDMYKNYGR